MEPFTKRVIQYIQQIPEGKVATYGQIAKLAGNPRAARQVARILHTMSEKHQLPWHRVINAKGKITIANPERQIQALFDEGVEVTHDHNIHLQTYMWHPCDYDDWMNG